MKTYSLFLTEATKNDLKNAELFYEQQDEKLGIYFRDSIISDLDALVFYAGIHEKHFGYYRMLAKRFPFSLYYDIEESLIIVHAILDSRRDPKLFENRLS